MKTIITLTMTIFLLGCSKDCYQAYQEHGYAQVFSGTSGRMGFQFYEPVTLTQREIDSLNSRPDPEPEHSWIDSTGHLWLIINDTQTVYIDTIIIPEYLRKKGTN